MMRSTVPWASACSACGTLWADTVWCPARSSVSWRISPIAGSSSRQRIVAIEWFETSAQDEPSDIRYSGKTRGSAGAQPAFSLTALLNANYQQHDRGAADDRTANQHLPHAGGAGASIVGEEVEC